MSWPRLLDQQHRPLAATDHDAEVLRRAIASVPEAAHLDCDGTYYRGALHLAVMTGPYLRHIEQGCKTVESRFHRVRAAPLNAVAAGDVVVFRQSGRPAELAALVTVPHYISLAEVSLEALRAAWAEALCADDDVFWRERAQSRWVTLLELAPPFSIEPQVLAKRDRRAWVTYPTWRATKAGCREQPQ